jgi:hypothetical protein
VGAAPCMGFCQPVKRRADDTGIGLPKVIPGDFSFRFAWAHLCMNTVYSLIVLVIVDCGLPIHAVILWAAIILEDL